MIITEEITEVGTITDEMIGMIIKDTEAIITMTVVNTDIITIDTEINYLSSKTLMCMIFKDRILILSLFDKKELLTAQREN